MSVWLQKEDMYIDKNVNIFTIIYVRGLVLFCEDLFMNEHIFYF